MAPLTYARLLTRLEALFNSVPEQLPGNKNAQRVKDIQYTISAGLVAVRAGLCGDENVLKPSELKHNVLTKVDEINLQFEEEEREAKQASAVTKTAAVTKRPMGTEAMSTSAGVKKPTSKRVTRSKSRITSTTLASIAATATEQEAAAALLSLFASKPPTATIITTTTPATAMHQAPYVAPTANMIPTNTSAATKNDKGKQRVLNSPPSSPLSMPNLPLGQTLSRNPFRRNRFGADFIDLPLNAVDHTATPEQNFLAGALFATQNFTASHKKRCGNIDDDFAQSCYDYVRVELGIKSDYELAAEAHHAERATKEGAEKADLWKSGGKNFWDVV